MSKFRSKRIHFWDEYWCSRKRFEADWRHLVSWHVRRRAAKRDWMAKLRISTRKRSLQCLFLYNRLIKRTVMKVIEKVSLVLSCRCGTGTWQVQIAEQAHRAQSVVVQAALRMRACATRSVGLRKRNTSNSVFTILFVTSTELVRSASSDFNHFMA